MKFLLTVLLSFFCILNAQVVENDKIRTDVGGDLNALTLNVSIPAPRGVITDRNGKILAGTKVKYFPAIDFRFCDKETKEEAVEWAAQLQADLNQTLGHDWEISKSKLASHYQYRKWLLYPFGRPLTDAEYKILSPKKGGGLDFFPVYSRYYPENALASHFIGYIGATSSFQRKAVANYENLWPDEVGRDGLEKLYNDHLAGTPGRKKIVFDGEGTLLRDRTDAKPIAGGNIITTLNVDWQKKGESILNRMTSSGALVVVDVETGEVLVMASNPSYDLNIFSPRISPEDFAGLQNDQSNPFFNRAYKGVYPPASTFKPFVGLSALHHGFITPDTMVDSPAQVTIGSLIFKNWTRKPEGEINMARALARSCNTWFYRVGIATGAGTFLNTAGEFGFGQKTGLPLIGEAQGRLPSEQVQVQQRGWGFGKADAANFSIGQGKIESSPLQLAQAMAGLALGDRVPQLQLIHQLQDRDGNVTFQAQPSTKNVLTYRLYDIQAVHEGMWQVVNSDFGTGKNAKLSFAEVCGKTGTAEWGAESDNKRLAWFAGFLPRQNPKYAFVSLYEGKKNEKVGGGTKAAPIIREFFKSIKKDIEKDLKDRQRNNAQWGQTAQHLIQNGVYHMPIVFEQDFWEVDNQEFIPNQSRDVILPNVSEAAGTPIILSPDDIVEEPQRPLIIEQ